MSTRYVGTCPVCGERYKVRDGVLVHHGYQRPGFGCIVGDCFAVHMEPHEASSRTAEKYREHLLANIEVVKTQRTQTHSAEQLSYEYKVYESFGKSRFETVILRKGDQRKYGSPSFPSFDEYQKVVIRSLTQQIDWMQATAEQMAQLVETWTLQPLTTVEEETKRLDQAAREAREARRAATRGKREATAARKAERDRKAGEKLASLVQRAQAILDKADSGSVRAIRDAYLQVLRIKRPVSLEDRFFTSLNRDELLRRANLFLSHNDQRLIRHEYQVLDLIHGRMR